MLTLDDSRPGLLAMTISTPLEAGDVQRSYAAIDALLAAAQPFALVIDFGEIAADPADTHGVAALHMAWINGAREAMSQHCRGIAYVLGSQQVVDMSRDTIEKSAAAMWGTAVEPVVSLSEGIAWAEARLRS
jgi:hypothetical protein